MLFLIRGLRGIVDQQIDATTCVPALGDLVEHHGMRDLQMRCQGFGGGVDEFVESVSVPGDESLRRFLALDFLELFGISSGLGDRLLVFDLEFRCLGDDQPLGVESHAAGSPCDLMEFAGAQSAHLGAVEFGERCEHHGVDRHVNAHAQGVGAADHRQQTLLRQLLHQTTIAGEHAGVMDADARAQQALQDLAEGGGEFHSLDGLRNGGSLFLGAYSRGGERVGGVERRVLREVDDVDRCLPALTGEFHGAFQRVERVFVAERHRSRRIGDHVDVRGVVQCGELVRNGVHVAECGAHQQELGLGERKERHLPCPSAFGVAVVMEFVHGDQSHVGVAAFAQGLIGEDLGGAADDRRVRVDMAVAGDHAHLVAAEHRHQIEEFFGYQRLDRGGVVRAAAGAQGREMHAEGDQRFARAGGRVEDHVIAGQDVENGLLLMGPGLDAFDVGDPVEEALIYFVGVDIARARPAVAAAVPIRGQGSQ